MHGRLKKNNTKGITRHKLINYANQISLTSTSKPVPAQEPARGKFYLQRRQMHQENIDAKIATTETLMLYKQRSNLAVQTENQRRQYLFPVGRRFQRQRKLKYFRINRPTKSSRIYFLASTRNKVTYRLAPSKKGQVYGVTPLRSVPENAPKPPSLHSFSVLK